MNREAVIRAAYFLCRALGRRTGRREVNAVIVALIGKGFRWEEIDKTLAAITRGPLGDQAGTSTGTTIHAQNGVLGTTESALSGPRARELELELELVDSLRSSTYVVPTQAEKRNKNRKLPFDRAELDARDAILRVVWQHIQPIIGRSTTWTDWRGRNQRIAMSFARGGFAPDQVEKAWQRATDEAREPIRELSRVQRFLERAQVYRATHNARRSP